MTTHKRDVVKAYFRLLETFATDAAAFAPYVHPEMQQTEFPNALNPRGQTSDWADVLRRAAVGKTIMARQTFEIVNCVESGDQMVVEATWNGVMARNAGPLKADQRLTAHFCVVLEFRDGKIVRQRNYDCFEPFT